MGTILTFQAQAHTTRPQASRAEMGKLLLFTGVRYERVDEASRLEEGPHPRPMKSRRRS